jgi:hypothetical protein
MNRYARIVKAGLITLVGAAGLTAILTARADDQPTTYAHVLLLSVDGLHASDLDWIVTNHPDWTLAQLSAHGRTYTNASATKPSDSFPGMLAMVTGGTPRSTGVYYDDGWDRSLASASALPGPTCVPGTRVQWKQNLDATPLTATSWATYAAFWPTFAGITLNAAKLPFDQAGGCVARVFPHQFPRVNNVFELVKAMGGRTAWSDKHSPYEFLNGPSGTGLDDLYTPEIATTVGGVLITNSFALTMAYDDLKVAAIVNEINGYDHSGTIAVGTPALFGMNFQAVSVGQKLVEKPALLPPVFGGYDDNLVPSAPLQSALEHTDASIGTMVSALQAQGLLDSTLIIVSAKHGNSPMKTSTLVKVDPTTTIANVVNAVPNVVNGVQVGLLALLSADTGPLIWLKDQSRTADVVAALNLPANRAAARIDEILSGEDLAELFVDPSTDSRVPDIILLPLAGTVYTTSGTKIADHGGFGDEDVHVALLVSNSLLPQKTINDEVETRQIACTILKAFTLDCGALDSQNVEPSKFLPNSNHDWAYDRPAGTLGRKNR